MKHNFVKTMELSLLVLLLLACVGAVSTLDFAPTLDSTSLPAATELENRFLEYLKSPNSP